MSETHDAPISATDLSTLRDCSQADLIIQTDRRSWACVHAESHAHSLSTPSLKRLLMSEHLKESEVIASLGEGTPMGPVLFLTQKGRDALKP